MQKMRILWVACGALLLGQAAFCATPGKTLWIAKFKCDTRAAQAVAAVQQQVPNALQYSNLFANVTTFTSEAAAPAGAWTLKGKEVKYSPGSAAMRGLIGFGSGRARLVMRYELINSKGKMVWKKEISSSPPFWGSYGAKGMIQSQRAAVTKQAQDLVNGLQSFFDSGASPGNRKS
jgi:hypothetical protein